MKKLAILGDSYSTYADYIPKGYASWYNPGANALENDVQSVNDTWWKLFCEECHYEVVLNSSYSGSAVSYTGYPEMDSIKTSFLYRMQQDFAGLKEKNIQPDLILIFGGTNDFWNNSPIGTIVEHSPTEEECLAFAPAFCKVMQDLKKDFPKSQLLALVNDDITSEIRQIQQEAGKLLDFPVVLLKEIEKENGHPNRNGMKEIAKQLQKALEHKMYGDGKQDEKQN